MKRNTCINCEAYEPELKHGVGVGSCHMNPPTIQLVMIPGARTPSNPNGAPQLTAQGFWAPVRGGEDFCLKFKAATVN